MASFLYQGNFTIFQTALPGTKKPPDMGGFGVLDDQALGGATGAAGAAGSFFKTANKVKEKMMM